MNKSLVFTGLACLFIGLFSGHLINREKSTDSDTQNVMMNLANCADSLRSVVFSCAMHPQVQHQFKGQCPFCGMALTTSVRNAYQQKLRVSMTEAAMQLAQVRTEKIGYEKHSAKTILVDGELTLDEGKVFHQIAHLPGRIEKLYVNKVGTFVKKGDPIAHVYSKELIAVVEAFEYSKKSDGVLRSAINNIKSWKVTTDQLNDMKVQSGRYQKAVDVYADFTGTVLEMMVKEGEYAVNTHMGAPTTFYKIADLSSLWGIFEIHEKDLGQVKVGELITFSVPAYPNEVFSAKVNKIYPEVDSRTHRIRIRTVIQNQLGRLKPGMLATGKMMISSMSKPQLSIPKTAVLWTGKHSLVYVKDIRYEQPVFEWRSIKLGEATEQRYIVESGLIPGEEIVINGALRVDAAAQLERKYSMMNQPLEKITENQLQLVNN